MNFHNMGIHYLATKEGYTKWNKTEAVHTDFGIATKETGSVFPSEPKVMIYNN